MYLINKTRIENYAREALIGIFFFIILLTMALVATSQAVIMNGAGLEGVFQVEAEVCEEGTFSPLDDLDLNGDVMLYCGNSGQCWEGLTILTNFYVSMGVTVAQLNTLPADLSSYKLIFIVMPRTYFSTDQIDNLASFVQGNGRLVLLSDWYGFYTGQDVLNDLLDKLGVSIRFDKNPGVDIGCENFTSNIVSDQITEGVTSFEYAFTDTVTSWGTAKILLYTKGLSGNPMAAVDQPSGVSPRPGADVVAVGDSNSFTDLCTPANNTFWWNLYNYVAEIEVEIDIKPGSFPSSINLKNKGVIPVAIHTTDDFDATTVDPTTVLLNGVAPIRWEIYDCDEIPNPDYDSVLNPDVPETIGDGDLDLVLYFSTPELASTGALNEGDTEATLTGKTFDGIPIVGTGDVRIVGVK